MFFRRFMDSKRVLARNERGSVLPLLSLSLAALMGFSAIVMDYGAAALLRRRLVTAADAAALAGAQELVRDIPAADAVRKAMIFAELNGVPAGMITASVAELSPDVKAITVQVEDDAAFHFARIFGIEGMNIGARARAVAGPVAALSGIVPLGIAEQVLHLGEEYRLKESEWKDAGLGPGSFGALALGGGGASRYRNNIKYGFNSLIAIGDILDMKQGNVAGPTRQGILHRINEAGNCGCTPPGNIEPGCPLLVFIPVVRPIPKSNRVEVVNFAAFYINKNNPPGGGRDSIVTGTFVRNMTEGRVDTNLSSYGLFAVNLVE